MSTLHIETTKPLTAFFACTREGQKVTSPKLSELAKMPSLPCPECEGKLVLRLSKYGLFYGCIITTLHVSNAWFSSRWQTSWGAADKETKFWRIKAHKAFDKLFEGENPLMSREEAYAYLQIIMKLTEEEAHIGKFTVNQCKELIDLLDFKQ